MNHYDLELELRRFPAWSREPDEGDRPARTAYVEELDRKFAWMAPPVWRKVVSWAIDHHKWASRMPSLWDFTQAWDAVATRIGRPARKTCSRCDGIGWVTTYLRRLTDDSFFEAVAPCPNCAAARDQAIDPQFQEVEAVAYRYANRVDEPATIRAGWKSMFGWEWPAETPIEDEAALLWKALQTGELRLSGPIADLIQPQNGQNSSDTREIEQESQDSSQEFNQTW